MTVPLGGVSTEAVDLTAIPLVDRLVVDPPRRSRWSTPGANVLDFVAPTGQRLETQAVAQGRRTVINTNSNKQQVQEFIDAVWVRQDLDALDGYWTADCVNHAAPPGHDVGLAALRAYHEQFAAQFAAFDDATIEVLQQVAEDDRVVTQLLTRARHTAKFAGVPATGRAVLLATIRVDRLEGGRIAEHWSVADVAGLLQQLQG